MFFHRRAELGSYAPHEFCIEMSAEHALVDAARKRVDPLSAATLSTFVHEYFHYLQNVSTVSGFTGYHAAQQLLALFSATMDGTGRSVGASGLDTKEKGRLTQINAYLDLLEGDQGPEHAILEGIERIDATRRDLPFGAGVAKLSDVSVDCRVIDDKGVRRSVRSRLGLCMIEEGLAFEIDRLVAGIDGQQVVLDAPSFPYLVLRMMGDYLAPGISKRNVIACGTLALLTNDPAGTLVDALRDFGDRCARGDSPAQALLAVEEATRDARLGSIAQIVVDLDGLKKMHADRGASSEAMARLVQIFTLLLQRRTEDPLWDVRPFLADPIDQSLLTDLMANVEPCLVLQRLPDDPNNPDDADSPEHDLMLAFGTQGTATPEMTKRAVPVLQCQIHYVNAHLPNAEFIASGDVDVDAATCPFYRSCTLQLRRDHAELCKDAPWEIYARSTTNTCWYGAAVAGTIGTVKSLEAPMPADEMLP